MHKVLVKRLAFVSENLAVDTRACPVPNRSIYDNLHPMQYIVDRVVKKPDMSGVLINLNQ